MSAVTFTTRKSAIRTTVSHQEHLLKNCLKTGVARTAAWVKTSSQKSKIIKELWEIRGAVIPRLLNV